MADVVYYLAATDIAPKRDLTPSGTLHAYADGVGTTVCGLELGREVRLFPDSLWNRQRPGTVCPVCAEGIEPSG
jgi:hypothetical protein